MAISAFQPPLRIKSMQNLPIVNLEHSENTHLFHKGNIHCMADLLFYWFGLNQTSKSVQLVILIKLLDLNKSNRRSVVQYYLPSVKEDCMSSGFISVNTNTLIFQNSTLEIEFQIKTCEIVHLIFIKLFYLPQEILSSVDLCQWSTVIARCLLFA